MKNRSNCWIQNISVVLIYIAATFFTSAQEQNTKGNIETIPLALQGYDVISYYTNDFVLKGSNQFQATYKGKRYTFITQENQLLFAKNPGKYLPKLEGFCAQSASQHKMLVGDPSIYVIDKGELYFFHDNQAKNIWNQQDGDKKIVNANKYWKYTAEKLNSNLKAKKLWKEKNTVELFTF